MIEKAHLWGHAFLEVTSNINAALQKFSKIYFELAIKDKGPKSSLWKYFNGMSIPVAFSMENPFETRFLLAFRGANGRVHVPFQSL